jgi:hypothetical protein
MKLIITKQENDLWRVDIGDKYSDNLAIEEMLGIVIQFTFPQTESKFSEWMKTEEEWKLYEAQVHI